MRWHWLRSPVTHRTHLAACVTPAQWTDHLPTRQKRQSRRPSRHWASLQAAADSSQAQSRRKTQPPADSKGPLTAARGLEPH